MGLSSPGAPQGPQPAVASRSKTGPPLQQRRSGGYGALMRVPGFARLYAGLLLGRMGGSMMGVALVLFVLERYHSPGLAGLAAFMGSLPGVIVSPVAGALLDRYGRARLVVLDYALA